jgi:two-component system, sensor histidine kinase and response regulator
MNNDMMNDTNVNVNVNVNDDTIKTTVTTIENAVSNGTQTQPATAPENTSTSPNKRLIVICVDDEEIVLEALQMELSEEIGLEMDIETVQSGKEAISLVKRLTEDKQEVAVMICDYVMPELYGDETLKHAHILKPEMVNIMLTGQSTAEGITNAINEANLYRFVSKPWVKENLVATVREAAQKYVIETKLVEDNRRLTTTNDELQESNAVLDEGIRDRTQMLERVVAELRQLNADLKEADTMKTRLMSIVSHDLKNPLSRIQTLSSMLTTEQLEPAQQTEILTIIEQSADHMMQLIKDLLDSTATELGRIKLDPGVWPLSEIVEQVCDEYLKAATHKQQQLVLELSEKCPVNIDVRRFWQVIANLVSNAIKYSPKGSTITVRVKQHKDNVRLEVQDEGPGLTEDDQERLFGFFQRLSAQPTDGEPSTGVGLAVVEQIVNLHGGKVWCDSTPGNGAMFVVELALHHTED